MAEKPLFDLAGRVAVVTGGNGGIGLGIARGFARSGAAVVIAGRNAEKGKAAAKELQDLTPQCDFIRADVTIEADCAGMIAMTVERFGKVDILVNNAGIVLRKPPQDYTEANWHTVIDSNLTSAFLCAKAAYGSMKLQGQGKIINIGSVLSVFALPLAAAYCASKGGVVQLTKGLATAWASSNIQVNAILPGWIDTEMTRTGRKEIPGLDQKIRERTPLGRWGIPDDLAGTAIFLAAHASDFLTGTTITVDGGYSCQG